MAINDNDLLLINDSQDSNEAKKIKYSTLKSNINGDDGNDLQAVTCLLYTSPSPRDRTRSRMPSSA